ncbi:unnamed protein product [Clavelina lepadiformis]|uniref:Gypsy retrotransposon integrase-like protein 1 n=1 Tax=Clavelina lepadiformis TaxID=159417 RepID=A0ABP0FA48_CLALP
MLLSCYVRPKCLQMQGTMCLPCQICKKRPRFSSRPLLNSVEENRSQRATFYVYDCNSALSFLVDSGSDVSVLPSSFKGTGARHPITMQGPTVHSSIRCSATTKLKLDLGFSFCCPWSFYICDKLRQPILGADFLRHYGLLVDVKHRRLLHPYSHEQVSAQYCGGIRKKIGISSTALDHIISDDDVGICGPLQASAANTSRCDRSTSEDKDPSATQPVLDANNSDSKPPLALLEEFPEITAPLRLKLNPKHNIKHYINTTGPPVFSRCRRMSPELARVLRKELDKLLEAGIITPVSQESQWASPIVLVKKKTGSYRLCTDFRQANLQIPRDTYPLPHLQDFLNELDGVSNVATFIDDILIFSKSPEEHREHLRTVFERLSRFGLVINREKSIFFQEEIKFLGHMVSKNGILPLRDRVAVIRKYPLPDTVKELRRFLGMFGFYRRFIKHCAALLIPLNSMLCKVKRPSQKLAWSEEAQQAFQDCKERLASATELCFPKINANYVLSCDASGKAVGAVLAQCIDNKWQPLAFFSKALNSAQRNYSTFDRELTALFLATRHFADILIGRSLTLVTDHRPITQAFQKAGTSMSPRQTRQFSYLSQFTDKLIYQSGLSNVIADSLSRIEINTFQLQDYTIDYEQFAQDQMADASVTALLTDQTGLKLERRKLPDSDLSILGDISQKRFRPIVPTTYRDVIFHNIHSLSHSGYKSTLKQIGERFVWSGMKTDVKNFCRTCLPCQQSKVSRHNKTPLQPHSEPTERFRFILADIVGPLVESDNCRYILTFADRFTKWVEAIPIPDATAATIARNFLLHIVGRYGVPEQLHTDRGQVFMSKLFTGVCRTLGVKLVHSLSFRPSCLGFLERTHRTLKGALRACEFPQNWTANLGLVLLGLRTSLKEHVNCSPAELVYGSTLRVPGQFFEALDDDTPSPSQYVQHLTDFMATLRCTPPVHHDTPPVYIDKSLADCTHVFVRVDASRPSLSPPYAGPYKVLAKYDKYFTLAIVGQHPNVSVDRLKVAHLPVFDSVDISIPPMKETDIVDEVVRDTNHLPVFDSVDISIPPMKETDIVDEVVRDTNDISIAADSNVELSGLPTSPVDTAEDIAVDDIYRDALTDIPPLRTTSRGRQIHLPKRFQD